MAGLMGSKGMKSFGRYGGVGFELLGSIAVGYYGGHWLDGKFGTRWIALIGFLIGCYAGFRALFRAAKMMTRDAEHDEMLARGEDPWAPKSKDDDYDYNDHDDDVIEPSEPVDETTKKKKNDDPS